MWNVPQLDWSVRPSPVRERATKTSTLSTPGIAGSWDAQEECSKTQDELKRPTSNVADKGAVRAAKAIASDEVRNSAVEANV